MFVLIKFPFLYGYLTALCVVAAFHVQMSDLQRSWLCFSRDLIDFSAAAAEMSPGIEVMAWSSSQ